MSAQDSRDVERRLRSLSAAVRRVRIDHLQRVERIQAKMAELFGYAVTENMVVADQLVTEAYRWSKVEFSTQEAIWTAAEVIDSMRDELAEIEAVHRPGGPVWEASCPRCDRPDALSDEQLNAGETCGYELCGRGISWLDPDRPAIFEAARRLLRSCGGRLTMAEALDWAIAEVKGDGGSSAAG